MTDKRNRIEELLIDRATDSLPHEEQKELQSLLQQEQIQDDFSYDELVASMQESLLNKDMQSLPDHIRAAVIDRAETMIPPGIGPAVEKPSDTVSGSSGLLRREMWAWLATAASLSLAAFLWWQTNDPQRVEVVQAMPLISSSSQVALEDFISSDNSVDTLEVELAAGNHESGKNSNATVYWNRKLKKGFLKVNNLAKNNPTAEQYQLWIIDRQRGIEDRPNAGVFDIAKAGVNIFEFRSELEIMDAQGFAVTVEKPGGVAVSDLKRISLANLGT